MGQQAQPEDDAERLLRAATRLFAELGYDETSTRMVADAAGIDLARTIELAGSKRDLYLTVMARAYQAEQAMLEQAAAEFTPDLAGLYHFIDLYLDFFVANPQIAALWIQRRLYDAADVVELEKLYSLPQINLVAESVGDVIDPGLDLEFALWTVVWAVHSFVQGGMPDDSGRRVGPQNRRLLSRFREYLHQLVARMTLPSP